MRIPVLAVLAGFVAMGLAAPTAAKPTGSCVTCHRTAADTGSLLHTFQDWTASPHAAHSVGCDACHGGDPAKTDKAAAHAGLLGSKDAASPVYFTRIPETCGHCHAGEFKAFRQSKHFQELQTSGRGPNCVTCHGAMANHVLDPHSLEQVCTVCHRRPTQAYAALLSLNHAVDQLRRLKTALSKADRAAAKPQADELAALLKLKSGVVVDWHTFNMPEVIRLSQEIAHRAGAAVNELSLQQKKGGS